MRPTIKQYWHQYMRTEGSSTLSTFADNKLRSIQITFTSPLKKMTEGEVQSVCAMLNEAFGKDFSFGYRSYNTRTFPYTKNKHGVFTATEKEKGAQDGYKIVLNNTFDINHQLDDMVSQFPPNTAENNYSFKIS